MKKYLLYLLAFGTFAGCKKDNPGPDQTDQANTASSMEMKLDGQNITLGKDKIQALYYADEGESTGALEISGQLADGGRIVFFLDETKAKTINLEQKFPAVMNVAFGGTTKSGVGKLAMAKTANTTQGTFTVPVYAKYVTKTCCVGYDYR